MRDYLYIWIEREEQYLVASGIQLSDVLTISKPTGGIILLKHSFELPTLDSATGFDYVPAGWLSDLLGEDVDCWGDCVWVDYASPVSSASTELPPMERREVAELLYFAHTWEPYGEAQFPSLSNRFLGALHDDGWFQKLHYNHWTDLRYLLAELPVVRNCAGALETLESGESAYWIDETGIEEEERTTSIDVVLNRRL